MRKVTGRSRPHCSLTTPWTMFQHRVIPPVSDPARFERLLRVYLYSLFVIGISLFFYAVLPGYGGLIVRRRWRRFRRRIVEASLRRTVRYGDLAHSSGDGPIGHFRFIGSLEAIQHPDTVWVHDEAMSVSAELGGSTVYLLPSASQEDGGQRFERNAELLPDEMPQELPWSRISTLTEGTQLFVSGALYAERGHAVFRPGRGDPLTVLLFDGDERTVMRRAIWSGRQRNEYWNQLTLVSLLAGGVAQLVMLYYLSFVPMLRPAAILAFLGGILPLVPFFPPGVVLFLLYRYLWRVGRVKRAERDLLSLPVRYYDADRPADEQIDLSLPDGEIYSLRTVGTLEAARAIAPGATIRTTSVGVTGATASVFGSPLDRTSGSPLAAPTDPLCEHVIIPGDPWELSRRCDHSARLYELIAAASFVTGTGVNALILLALLVAWIR
jgi:hypothetical protein